MPDLGKYADAVFSAYAVSLVLLLGIVVLSVIQSRKAAARLAAAEERRNSNG